MDISSLTPEFITSMIDGALNNVFSTMMSKEVQLENTEIFTGKTAGERAPTDFGLDKTVVTGSVGFTGSVNGIIYISMDEDLAVHLSGAFLGMDREEILEEGDDMVNDALGELTNMSVGDFKNKLCDKGFNCMLTLPSILRGQKLSVVTHAEDGVFRYIFHFKSDGQPLVVDLIFKPTE